MQNNEVVPVELKFIQKQKLFFVGVDVNCPAPPNLSNIKQVTVYRRNSHGCYNPVTSKFKFDDVAVYECRQGYSLRHEGVYRFCTGRGRWSHPKKIKCVREFNIEF